MKLILHIGTTKTGSKSIQSFLRTNRARLFKKGFYYPKSLGELNHVKFGAYCSGLWNNLDLYELAGVTTIKDILLYRKKIMGEFRDEISSLRHVHSVIISNEHLHSRCYKEKSFKRMAKLIENLFSEVTVLCYLRPPLDHAISLYATFLKHGYTKSIDDFMLSRLKNAHPYFDHKHYLSLWVAYFKKENVNLRLFDDAKRLEHGVLSDFIRFIGLSEEMSAFTITPKRNISVNTTGQSLLRIRNRYRNPYAPTPSLDHRINMLIEKEFPGPGALPSLAISKKFHDTFESGTDWVEQNWFPNRPEALNPDWSKLEKRTPPPNDRRYDEIAAIFKRIYKKSASCSKRNSLYDRLSMQNLIHSARLIKRMAQRF